jgi:hypothetical protein
LLAIRKLFANCAHSSDCGFFCYMQLLAKAPRTILEPVSNSLVNRYYTRNNNFCILEKGTMNVPRCWKLRQEYLIN